MFLNNRYHDPLLGSFISVDPLVTKTNQPYIYGTSNPISYSDSSGLEVDGIAHALDCIVSPGSCSAPDIRDAFRMLHEADEAMGVEQLVVAISAVIDVAHQGDWDELDGNWSSDDIHDAADGTNFDRLGVDNEFGEIVSNVASAFSGHEDEWEQFDTDLRSFWDRQWGKAGGGLATTAWGGVKATYGVGAVAVTPLCGPTCAVYGVYQITTGAPKLVYGAQDVFTGLRDPCNPNCSVERHLGDAQESAVPTGVQKVVDWLGNVF